MIEPPHILSSGSLETDVSEWVESTRIMGWAEDWDGSDRPGVPAAIAENLPSNETPTECCWDLTSDMSGVAGKPLAYWFFGPSNYRRLVEAAASTN